MNSKKAIELLPIITAFTEGKPIQHRWNKHDKWIDTDPSDVEFDGAPEWRIKPTPTLRPWKPEEAKNYVGCPILCIGTGSIYLITGVCCVTLQRLMTSGGEMELYNLSKTYKVTLDHGKTWLPCGVEE